MIRTLSTSEFARALGLSESSVRRLTDTGDLEVHRTRGGHRRIPVAEAIRYIRATQSQVLHPEMLGLDSTPAAASIDSPHEKMLQVLEEGHANAVTGLMQWLFASGMSVAELCDGPIVSSLRSIGDRWPHDKRAIFVEHRATVLCSRALNQLRLSIPTPDEDAPKAIGAAVSGDMYLLPTLMASLVLHEAGFNETNLGPNTPLDVLADAVIDERPDMIWLSISEPFRSHVQQLEIIKLAEMAQKTSTSFVIGGRHTHDLSSIQTDAQGEFRWIVCGTMAELRQVAEQHHEMPIRKGV